MCGLSASILGVCRGGPLIRGEEISAAGAGDGAIWQGADVTDASDDVWDHVPVEFALPGLMATAL